MVLTPVTTLSGHEGRTWCVSWSPTANLLATCGEDANIRLWGKEDKGTDEGGGWENMYLMVCMLGY